MVSKVRRVPSIKVFAKPPEFPWLSQVKSIHKQQTTIRKPIESAPEASRGLT
jgi:hypothetical protein